MKRLLLIFIIFCTLHLPVKADVIWPSLYITKGMLSLYVIISGLIIETLFIKYFTKIDWKKSAITSFLMNLITTLTGLIFIPISGLGTEIIFDFVFHAYDKFGIGTFHWSHWLVSYILVIIINTLIEGFFIKHYLKLELKQTFWWLFFANAISVIICFITMITSTL